MPKYNLCLSTSTKYSVVVIHEMVRFVSSGKYGNGKVKALFTCT